MGLHRRFALVLPVALDPWLPAGPPRARASHEPHLTHTNPQAEEEDPEALEAEYEKQLEALAFGSGTDDDDAGGSDQRPTSATTFAALHKAMGGGAGGGGEAAQEADEAGGAVGAAARAEVKRLLEEYYKLDYEGVAGGVRTRFR